MTFLGSRTVFFWPSTYPVRMQMKMSMMKKKSVIRPRLNRAWGRHSILSCVCGLQLFCGWNEIDHGTRTAVMSTMSRIQVAQ